MATGPALPERSGPRFPRDSRPFVVSLPSLPCSPASGGFVNGLVKRLIDGLHRLPWPFGTLLYGSGASVAATIMWYFGGVLVAHGGRRVLVSGAGSLEVKGGALAFLLGNTVMWASPVPFLCAAVDVWTQTSVRGGGVLTSQGLGWRASRRGGVSVSVYGALLACWLEPASFESHPTALPIPSSMFDRPTSYAN